MEYESICVLLPSIAYRKYYKRLKLSFTQFWAVMLITRSTIKRHHWRKVDNEKFLLLVLDCVSWQPYVVLNLWCHKTVTRASYPTSASHSVKSLEWNTPMPSKIIKLTVWGQSLDLYLLWFPFFLFLITRNFCYCCPCIILSDLSIYFYLVTGIYISIKLFTSR